MKQSRTKYWEHIMLIAPTGEKKEWESNDAIAAWCLKCKEKIPYKLNDVNSVKRHIQEKHPNLFKEEGSKKWQKTSTLHDCFASAPKRDLKPSTTADQKMGEALLVQWTATSLQPFTIIKDKGFFQFVHWLYIGWMFWEQTLLFRHATNIEINWWKWLIWWWNN